MTTTVADIRSAAELERQRLASQAAQARESARAQAAETEFEVESQAGGAISETERQVQAAKAAAEQEAETRQGQIRKQRGSVEAQAQAAMGKARKAQAIEQRKVVLPITKPRQLGTASYIASVETARRQAQQAGSDAKVAVTKVRDNYFNQVDRARADAIADINKQKAGIIADIQTQLVNYNADLTKQLAQLNSGVNEWEADSKAKIQKAQADYEAAVQAALNRSGTDVFADMKDKGLIPANAVYDSYDKTTGQLNYTLPDTRSGQEIFADLQADNKIPPNATYENYDSTTGAVSYSVDRPNFGSGVFKHMQNAGKIPKDATFISYNATNKTVMYFVTGQGSVTIPETSGISPSGTGTTTTQGTAVSPTQGNTNVAIAAMAGAAVITAGEAGLGAAIAAEVPLNLGGPIGWIAFAAAAIGTTIYFERKYHYIANAINNALGKNKQQVNSNQASDAVVTDNAGSVAYTIQQFISMPQTKGGNIETFPYTKEGATTFKTIPPDIKPLETKTILEQARLQTEGIPKIKDAPTVMIRDPFNVPELQAKASNVLAAAAAVQTAANRVQVTTKTIPMTRQQWELVEEALRQGRVAQGKEIIDGLVRRAATPEIGRNLTEAYREYLRKKAILDAARKAYVESLNPRPVKGRGSTEATAAAVGVWLTQDIIQGEILKALNRGESTKSAVAGAQSKIRQMSKQLGLTQQQINAASFNAVYRAALSTMAQEAVKTASKAQTKGLTANQIKTQTLTATQTAVHTIVQEAVDTQTITQTQANELETTLDQVAEAVTELTLKLKLPKPSEGEATGTSGEKYPKGTIVWNMGNLRGKGDEYKIIPSPYTLSKPITSFQPPKGMTRTKGTPQQTLTFIGGKLPFSNVSFDLGVTDGFIDVKSRTIKFTGRGEQTNVGTRLPETTRGVALTDNPPLLEQLIKRGNGHRRARQGRTKAEPLVRIGPVGRKPQLVTRGVYTDRGGTRITRRPHKHWRRIY